MLTPLTVELSTDGGNTYQSTEINIPGWTGGDQRFELVVAGVQGDYYFVVTTFDPGETAHLRTTDGVRWSADIIASPHEGLVPRGGVSDVYLNGGALLETDDAFYLYDEDDTVDIGQLDP